MSQPRITLDQWAALIAVVEAGGYAQASARIHRTQSTVTYTIKASRLRSEASIPRRQKSYLWVANGCFANPDWAPGAPGGKPRLKVHAFKP